MKMQNNTADWNNLSMKQKAAFIRTAVSKGFHDIDSIKEQYHEFKTGGSTESPVYENLPRLLMKAGLNVKVTSGLRPGAKTAQGNISHHASGNAVDIVPIGNTTFEDIENVLHNNPAIRQYMLSHDLGLIDESGRTQESRDTMKKTKATGAHFHIGKDSKYASLYRQKVGTLQSDDNSKTVYFTNPFIPLENTNAESAQIYQTSSPQDILANVTIPEPISMEEDVSVIKEVPQIEIIKQQPTVTPQELLAQIQKYSIPVEVATPQEPAEIKQIAYDTVNNKDSFLQQDLVDRLIEEKRRKLGYSYKEDSTSNLFEDGGITQRDAWNVFNNIVATPKGNLTQAQRNYRSALQDNNQNIWNWIKGNVEKAGNAIGNTVGEGVWNVAQIPLKFYDNSLEDSYRNATVPYGQGLGHEMDNIIQVKNGRAGQMDRLGMYGAIKGKDGKYRFKDERQALKDSGTKELTSKGEGDSTREFLKWCAENANRLNSSLGLPTVGDAWNRHGIYGDSVILEAPYDKEDYQFGGTGVRAKNLASDQGEYVEENIDKHNLKTGDIVDIYYRGSDFLNKAYEEGDENRTNSHTGTILRTGKNKENTYVVHSTGNGLNIQPIGELIGSGLFKKAYITGIRRPGSKNHSYKALGGNLFKTGGDIDRYNKEEDTYDAGTFPTTYVTPFGNFNATQYPWLAALLNRSQQYDDVNPLLGDTEQPITLRSILNGKPGRLNTAVIAPEWIERAAKSAKQGGYDPALTVALMSRESTIGNPTDGPSTAKLWSNETIKKLQELGVNPYETSQNIGVPFILANQRRELRKNNINEYPYFLEGDDGSLSYRYNTIIGNHDHYNDQFPYYRIYDEAINNVGLDRAALDNWLRQNYKASDFEAIPTDPIIDALDYYKTGKYNSGWKGQYPAVKREYKEIINNPQIMEIINTAVTK